MSPIAGGWGIAGSQPMSSAVHRSPNKLWRSNSIFNLWYQLWHGEQRYIKFLLQPSLHVFRHSACKVHNRNSCCNWKGEAPVIINETNVFSFYVRVSASNSQRKHPLKVKYRIILSWPEVEFLDEIQTKVFRVFLLHLQSPLQLCPEIYISSNLRNLLQFLQFSYCTL